VKPEKTVHTHRTIMYSELSIVMDHGMENDDYIIQMQQNVFNKATQSGVKYTSQFLTRLYEFDVTLPQFKALKYYWTIAEEKDRVLLSFLYSIGNDYLLGESIPVVTNTNIGEKVTVDIIEEIVELHHPNKYSKVTRRSIGKNIASSWKQAGFITGKVKNIRTQPEINYLIIAFAFLLAYLNGVRGDFILKSNWIKALCLDESRIRSLAIEAGKRDLLQYQFAGNVTSLTFNNLLQKLNIDGLEN
jgi:hypothetical protein